MKFVLAANTMEHPGFYRFVRAAATTYPDAAFAICGDLLNVFPEPGEDMKSSIFYQIYGDLIETELERLRREHFRDVANSSLLTPLREMFQPDGATYAQGMCLASRRYARVFSELGNALMGQTLYYIPGNMDYPELSALFASKVPSITQLDGEILNINHIAVAGIGGIPHHAQPFGAVAPISPNEMTEEQYERRLAAVWGADVLISHLSPSESPALEAFVRQSPVRLVLCRAPFSLRTQGSCRGVSQCDYVEGKCVIQVRPFDYPENLAFIVDVSADPMVEPSLQIFDWRAPLDGSLAEESGTAASIAL